MSIARRTSIAIIGGGIGGLTAAASLLHAGFDAHVYEQAKALGEVGAGINIGPIQGSFELPGQTRSSSNSALAFFRSSV
jgi:glycine/D-amino acid oxidase-like deaminating enzyme